MPLLLTKGFFLVIPIYLSFKMGTVRILTAHEEVMPWHLYWVFHSGLVSMPVSSAQLYGGQHEPLPSAFILQMGFRVVTGSSQLQF